ncbi:MAG: hypothetical protein GY765_10905 [bacterium]|nr:hypothetical protein [bacterium]
MVKRNSAISILVLLVLWSFGMQMQAQSSITVLSPNGGEELKSGDIYEITWTSSGISGNVTIAYSVNNGTSWNTITSSTEDDGFYSWNIPNNISDNCLIRVSGGTSSGTGQCETRGTWIWASSIQNAARRQTLFEKLEAGRFNTVFVSAPRIGGNFGHCNHSNFLAFITEAKSRGLSVHAWILNHGRLWHTGVRAVEFTQTSEQNAQVAWVMDIMNTYGTYLDGIHFDYIRYLHSDVPNINGRMDAITTIVKRVKADLDADFPGKVMTAAVFKNYPYLGDHPSQNDPPEWFTNWRLANPGSVYGTDANPQHMFYQQDPVTWIREGGMAGIMPMQYATDDTIWKTTLERYISFNEHSGDPGKIYMGLGWMQQPDPRSSKGFDAPGIVRKIKYARSRGMNGFVLFILDNVHHNADDYELINALTTDSDDNDFEAPFAENVASCLCQNCSTPINTVSDTSDAVFSIIANQQVKSLTVTSPNNGEQWEINSYQTISWSSTGVSGNVKIELSTDNGGSWSTIVSSTPNTRSYGYTVPDSPSTKCLVKITSLEDASVSDRSNGKFSITDIQQGKSITIISPNGGELWTVRSVQNVTWTSAGISGNVNIELSRDGGLTWRFLKWSTPNDGSYSFKVPKTIGDSSQCIVRVRAFNDSKIFDVSDSTFTVKK